MGQTESFPTGEQATCSKKCRPCGAWDKEYNTVKVDGAALANKENSGPLNGNGGNKGNAMTKEEREALQRRQEQEEREKRERAEQQRKEMERRVQEEQERQQAEQRRQEAERKRREQEEHARQQLLRAQEEERLLQEALRREEEERLRQEAAAAAERERLAREAKQAEENQKKMQAWLKANGFKNVNELVRKKLHKVRPLHIAVQQKDAELVKLMLATGADFSLPNGNKELPLQLAEKLNKAGCEEAVIRAFKEKQAA